MEEDDSKTIHVAGEMSQTVETVFNESGFEMDLDPRNDVTENLPKILNEEDIKIELISQDGTVETIGTISRLNGGQNLREIGPNCERSVADEDVQMPNIEEFDEDSVTFKVDSQERFHTDFHITQPIRSHFECQFENPCKNEKVPKVRKAYKPRERPRFSCAECPFIGVNQSDYQKHRRAMHMPDDKFKCPHCDFATKTASGLKNHMLWVHYFKLKLASKAM